MTARGTLILAAFCMALTTLPGGTSAARNDTSDEHVYQDATDTDTFIAPVSQESSTETLPLQDEADTDELPPADVDTEQSMMDDYQSSGPPVVAWPGGRP